MPMVAVAVVSAAASMYSANKNAQAQSAAMGQQQGAANSQLALQQGFMDQQNSMYGPLMSQYVHEASGDKPLDYGLMSGQIQGGYDAAQRNLQGMLAARGMSASGLGGAGATGLEIGRAGALANAFQTGMDRRRQLGLNVLQHYNPAANVQGVAGAYGNLQNMYGQYSGMYGQAAAQGYGSAASSLGNAAQMWQMNQGGNQTPAGIIQPGQAQEVPINNGQVQMEGGPVPMPANYGLQQPQGDLFGQSTPFGAGGPGGYFGNQQQPFQPLGASMYPAGMYGATSTGMVN